MLKGMVQPECGCVGSPPGASTTPSRVMNSVTMSRRMWAMVPERGVDEEFSTDPRRPETSSAAAVTIEV